MKIGIAQINPTVGDLEGNEKIILSQIRQAEQGSLDLVIFPELSLTGYPPEDLILKPAFVNANIIKINQLASKIKKTAAIVGFIDQVGKHKYNAAAWIQNGKILKIFRKKCLPNYGVFDEARYFEPSDAFQSIKYKDKKIAVTICEDLWIGRKQYNEIKKLKPDLVINLSASPFHSGKAALRGSIIKKAAASIKKPIIYCNMIGGQDELVFDGGSFVCLPNRKIVGQCPQFETGLFTLQWQKNNKSPLKIDYVSPPKLKEEAEITKALILGTKDYVDKNKFKKVLIGLSGGIDSALVAALAVKALGPDRVIGVTMPSKYNSDGTQNDAKKLAENLGILFLKIPIEPLYKAYESALSHFFEKNPANIAEENIQARIRGNILMALSNKFGWMVLTTGNKSETSVGYCTLYGDMAGGFSVLKDVLKTTVYKISVLINKEGKVPLIPLSTLTRAPSAELRYNQKDEDSLGSYSVLDKIITGYVEENKSLKELIKESKAAKSHVARIMRLIDLNEYKRRQSPPGIKISSRAFGRDHRMPITNHFKP